MTDINIKKEAFESDEYFHYRRLGFNQAIDEIESKKNNYLGKCLGCGQYKCKCGETVSEYCSGFDKVE